MIHTTKVNGIAYKHEPIAEHNGAYRLETYHFSCKIRRANKAYDCDACGEKIPARSHYVSFTTNSLEWMGIETWREHGECYLECSGPMWDSNRPDWRWVPEWYEHCDICDLPVSTRYKVDSVEIRVQCDWGSCSSWICHACAKRNGIKRDDRIAVEDLVKLS